MNNTFQINKNTSIILYGASSIGIIAYEALTGNGYNVIGFIDKRAEEISGRFGLKVWNLKTLPAEINKKDAVILVAVKNVFDHENIVSELLKSGFENILYKPANVITGNGDEHSLAINEAYELLPTGNIDEHLSIYKTDRLSKYVFKDTAILRETSEYKTVLIPFELVYTDFYGEGKELFEDIPICFLYPHINLFSFLAGDSGMDCRWYIDFCSHAATNAGQIEITEAWKEYTIKNRAMIYEQMCKSLELDFDFFIRNAPNASYNSKGYFNLHSGKHRAAFFVSKRRQYIPLKISNSDYEIYLNTLKLNDIIAYINENAISTVTNPIPHPYFYNFPCNNREFFRTYLQKVSDYISKKNNIIVGMKILDINNDNGYISRFFSKIGCTVTRYQTNEFTGLLDELFYANNIGVSDSIVDTYDIAFYNYFENSISFDEILSYNVNYIIAIVPRPHRTGKLLFSGYFNEHLVDVIVIESQK